VTLARPDIITEVPTGMLSWPYIVQTASGETLPALPSGADSGTVHYWIFITKIQGVYRVTTLVQP
jgi:hypothetical protein